MFWCVGCYDIASVRFPACVTFDVGTRVAACSFHKVELDGINGINYNKIANLSSLSLLVMSPHLLFGLYLF